MLLIKQFFLLLFSSLIKLSSLQNVATSKTTLLNINSNSPIKKIQNTNVSITQTEKDKMAPGDITTSDTTADEIKNEVFVNEILETVVEPITVEELHQGPHYELNWAFIDKDTIRVTFELFSVPISLTEHPIKSESNDRQLNLLATMTTMPPRSLKSITLLQYLRFIIRPYHNNREIVLKMEKLILKNTTLIPYNHFSNSLRLTSLNHHEKYSICICYYQTNSSIKSPDLLLCQDVINDYSKFSQLKPDAKHGLLFITTQYSIIIGLLVVLQTVFTIRKRRIAQIIGQHLTTTAHSIRTTLSSVSLVRQSFSSLDTAADQQQQQQQHATNGHATRRESTIHEEGGLKKRIISSPAIVISEPSVTIHNDTIHSDETEPFLKQVPSKNHVHFLLGPGEGSDEDNDHEHDDTSFTLQPVSTNREPYNDQADALLSMAHILDTNKPWSRHIQHTSPV